MMHLESYTPSAAGAMLAHYERRIGERDHIDRDGLILDLAEGLRQGETAQARFQRICDGLELNSKSRPLADMLISVPKVYEGGIDEFFDAAVAELCERVGVENVIGAYVHLDEPGAQPHMHFAFVPVVDEPVQTNDKASPLLWTAADEKKNKAHKAGTQKVDSKGTLRWKRVPLLDEDGNPVTRHTAKASGMFSKKDMEELHPWMEQAMCERLGVERVGLLLDKDDDAKKLSDLDHREYVRATAEIKRTTERLEGVRRAWDETRGNPLTDIREALQERALDREIGRLEGAIKAEEHRISRLEQAVERVGERIRRLVERLESVRAQYAEMMAATKRAAEQLGAIQAKKPSAKPVMRVSGDVRKATGARVVDPAGASHHDRRSHQPKLTTRGKT